MQPIAEWLEELGLGQYAQLFVENGIHFSVLRHLTDQDLKNIGDLLGHRPKDAGSAQSPWMKSRISKTMKNAVNVNSLRRDSLNDRKSSFSLSLWFY
jgi:SAM domain (Sterile alpha motif)